MTKFKKKKQEKGSDKKSKTKATDTRESEADDNSDYGGLPNRDLKKNLGCG